jgi:hypothetical protein
MILPVLGRRRGRYIIDERAARRCLMSSRLRRALPMSLRPVAAAADEPAADARRWLESGCGVAA